MEWDRSTKPRFHEAAHRCGQYIISTLRIMGAGINQANAGEARLRGRSLHEVDIHEKIQQLGPIPDTVPVAWQRDSHN